MVKFWEFCVAIGLSTLVFSFVARVELVLIRDYMCNNSNRRKRQKGQNFIDWLFFRRFKDVIPTYYFIYYYSPFVVGILAIIVALIIRLIYGDASVLMRWLVGIHFFGHAIWHLIEYLSARDKNHEYDASRIVSKRKKK